MSDHVRVLISNPPKLPVSSAVGFIKGKSTIYLAQNFLAKQRNLGGESFWARGFYVSAVGFNEAVVQDYIRKQK